MNPNTRYNPFDDEPEFKGNIDINKDNKPPMAVSSEQSKPSFLNKVINRKEEATGSMISQNYSTEEISNSIIQKLNTNLK